ncbi:MAG: ribosome maturation factor RimM [Aeromicrobium sp.]|uniref:ribosome maturation factor RimM n=1 Tax=Aeromicrobium sp. TaxID=1871063 RepID=UPI003C3A1F40
MLVVVGRIARAHGLRGELGVQVRTDEPERRFAAGSSVVCGTRTLTVTSARWHSGRLLVTFDGVDDRTAAEALHGVIIESEIDPADLPDEPDEFYDRQLVGLEVRRGGPDGPAVGIVTAVLHLPDQDTLAIDIDGREVLVPFVTELVPDIDVAGGFVTVADVPGLLDPQQADVVNESDGAHPS